MIYYVTKYTYNGNVRFLLLLKISSRNMRAITKLKGEKIFILKLPGGLNNKTLTDMEFSYAINGGIFSS